MNENESRKNFPEELKKRLQEIVRKGKEGKRTVAEMDHINQRMNITENPSPEMTLIAELAECFLEHLSLEADIGPVIVFPSVAVGKDSPFRVEGKQIYNPFLSFLAGIGFPTPQEGYHDVDHVLSDLKKCMLALIEEERIRCVQELVNTLKEDCSSDKFGLTMGIKRLSNLPKKTEIPRLL